MKLAPLALALTFTASAFSQATFTDPANLRGERVRAHDGRELPVDQGASGLQQLLRKLSTRASILNIVAHPDDEDGGMLTFYSRGFGARVADMSLTRGEGGQNAMTGDFEDALGLLRTQELLASDRYPGIDQFFGTEVDFGFSKTQEEAFAKWTHDRVLYDAVRAIRLYRPLVITATFIGGVTDGHGQHQVSGQIAQEAFVAAADPKVFPEMIAEGILPWQALKIYARVPMQSISSQGLFDYATGQYTPAKFTNYVTGEVTTTQPSVDVVVHEGKPDPLLDGKSYVQFARIGLGMQKSQIGPGVRNAPSGTFDVSYHRYGSRLANQPAHEDSFFDGIDTSILGLQQYRTFPTDLVPKLAGSIDSAIKNFDPGHPQAIAPALADALKTVDELIRFTEKSNADAVERANALHELRIKRVQLNDALALSLGLALDATAQDADQVVNAPVSVTINLHHISDPAIRVLTWELASANSVKTSSTLGPMKGAPDNTTTLETATLTVPASSNAVITRPYFFRDNIELPVYQLKQPNLRNAAQTPAALTAWVTVNYSGVDIELARIVHDGPQPIRFVPALNLALSNHAQVLATDFKSISVDTIEHPTDSRATGLAPHAPGWKSSVWEPGAASPLTPGEIRWRLEPPPGRRTPATLSSVATLPNGSTVSEGYRPVGYGDLPRTNFFTPATVRIVPVDLKLPTRNRIAYLPGTGDDVPSALASIGLAPTILSIADLTATNLAKYDTVILGVRTYNAHPDLHGAPTQALLDYARSGGNVVVQYQTYEFTAADAPYPLALGSNEKVVDETDPVQLLDAASPLLTTPNRITPTDFNNWIEERGHGFLSTWDAHYTALTETHDPGQQPQRGGLITTPLGKGHWTYCAFALYRQLPEAVPGAYRLFINLLNP